MRKVISTFGGLMLAMLTHSVLANAQQPTRQDIAHQDIAHQDIAHQDIAHQDIAQAAGYKAMFTCSATFNGGKSVDMIKAHELTNIYQSATKAMQQTGEAVINRAEKYVSVSYTDALPPRISAWRPHLGCTALPQGADVDFIARLPRIKLKAPAHDPAHITWPEGDKLPDTPLDNSVDKLGLDATISAAFGQQFDGGKFGGATTAVVISQNGRIVGEKYLDGYTAHTSQRTWSVAKSIAVSVIGAAQYKGYINVKDKTGLKAWSRPGDPRAEITVENLLHMSSGLDSRPAGNRTDNIYLGGGLVAQYATKNPLEAKPGKRWRYANNDTMLAMRALREKMNDDHRFLEFPFKELLHKIGMYNTTPETDWDGDFVMSSQVWTTARDLARLGQLYLNGGMWNGERILPKGWSAYVASPAPAQPSNRQGDNADKPGRGYGAQFWLYENYPGVPDGTYAALGNRGQFIIIVPSRNVVIVRRGYDYSGQRFNGPAFSAEILKHLP
jgi:CubicO group peptidase (beta-lactamase class C family)